MKKIKKILALSLVAAMLLNMTLSQVTVFAGEVSLDLETPLITEDENGIATELIDFSEVNFNGNSAQESTNIIENAPQVSNVVVLKETEVDFPVQINYFRLFPEKESHFRS